jgi:1-acyl-sn-glycerol-3-phosphate acyltransferase
MRQPVQLLSLTRAPLLDARPGTRSPALVRTMRPDTSPRAARLARAAFRLVSFCATLAAVTVDFGFQLWLAGKSRDLRARCEWTSRSARKLMRCVNLRPHYSGEPPRAGLLVSNHLGYLDILVLAARQPAVFVSKADVRGWPVLGFLTRLAGTLFVRRERRTDVSPLNNQVVALLRAGFVVVVFPEGTSSDGHKVLPFFSSLLEPAVAGGCAVTPAFIRYELAGGSVEDEVCYWRDMTFGPHFLNLLTKREIRAHVRFGPARPAGDDRKQLARELQQAVRNLGGV